MKLIKSVAEKLGVEINEPFRIDMDGYFKQVYRLNENGLERTLDDPDNTYWITCTPEEFRDIMTKDFTIRKKSVDNMFLVKECLGEGPDLWNGLAEESSELTKACLKMVRASGWSNNATPMTVEEASENVVEELGDIAMVVELLDDKYKKALHEGIEQNPKWDRWSKRVTDYNKKKVEERRKARSKEISPAKEKNNKMEAVANLLGLRLGESFFFDYNCHSGSYRITEDNIQKYNNESDDEADHEWINVHDSFLTTFIKKSNLIKKKEPRD